MKITWWHCYGRRQTHFSLLTQPTTATQKTKPASCWPSSPSSPALPQRAANRIVASIQIKHSIAITKQSKLSEPLSGRLIWNFGHQLTSLSRLLPPLPALATFNLLQHIIIINNGSHSPPSIVRRDLPREKQGKGCSHFEYCCCQGELASMLSLSFNCRVVEVYLNCIIVDWFAIRVIWQVEVFDRAMTMIGWLGWCDLQYRANWGWQRHCRAKALFKTITGLQ